MLTLETGQTIAGAATSGANEVTCTLFGMELNGTTEVYKVLDQRQLAGSAATIYTAPGSTTTFVKSITVVNTDASNASTFQLYVSGTTAAAAITPAMVLPPGGLAIYEDGLGWQFFNSTGLLLQGNVVNVASGTLTYVCLTSDATTNSSTTGVAITGLTTALTAGTWAFTYNLLYNEGVTTTGISLGVNYTGTFSKIMGWMQFPGTGTSASTGAASMTASGATGQIEEAFGFRAVSTTSPNMGATVSVDAGNDNMCQVVGTLVCSGSGNIELWHAAEVAAASTIATGSNLILYKVA